MMLEMEKEAGIILDPTNIVDIKVLSSDKDAAWTEHHINFGVFLKHKPIVPGPKVGRKGDLVHGGMKGSPDLAGDGYHAWVPIRGHGPR